MYKTSFDNSKFGRTTYDNNFLSDFKPGLPAELSDSYSEKTIRKLIEKEIEPYLYSAKNSIKSVIDNFQNELLEYRNIGEVTSSFKQSIIDSKRTITSNKEEADKRYFELLHKVSRFEGSVQDLKQEHEQLNRKLEFAESSLNSVIERNLRQESAYDKLVLLEKSQEKMVSDNINQINLHFNNRFTQLENGLQNIKEHLGAVEKSVVSKDANQVNFDKVLDDNKQINRQFGLMEKKLNSEHENTQVELLRMQSMIEKQYKRNELDGILETFQESCLVIRNFEYKRQNEKFERKRNN